MLNDFNKKLQVFLNNDPELQRRLEGFKHFSGVPNGHYKRARELGVRAVDRAVRCYPFGGKSLLDKSELVSITINDGKGVNTVLISLKDKKFSVAGKDGKKPHLTLELSTEKFKKAILGRYRWIFLFGMKDVKLEHSQGLPHSDWVTILEVLVAMQELVEFDPDMWKTVESF
ncbi:SCP2 sterol-binding domain-containing protein [Spirochaetota bacterium]